jgi:hypothetical protein
MSASPQKAKEKYCSFQLKAESGFTLLHTAHSTFYQKTDRGARMSALVTTRGGNQLRNNEF